MKYKDKITILNSNKHIDRLDSNHFSNRKVKRNTLLRIKNFYIVYKDFINENWWECISMYNKSDIIYYFDKSNTNYKEYFKRMESEYKADKKIYRDNIIKKILKNGKNINNHKNDMSCR